MNDSAEANWADWDQDWPILVREDLLKFSKVRFALFHALADASQPFSVSIINTWGKSGSNRASEMRSHNSPIFISVKFCTFNNVWSICRMWHTNEEDIKFMEYVHVNGWNKGYVAIFPQMPCILGGMGAFLSHQKLSPATNPMIRCHTWFITLYEGLDQIKCSWIQYPRDDLFEQLFLKSLDNRDHDIVIDNFWRLIF